MRGPWAVMPSVATFTASWRDSCQGWQSGKQESYQYKDNGNQNKSIPRIHFTHHDGTKGGLRNPEAELKLAVLPSYLRITVLGCPPLSEETLGVIAVV